MFVLEGHALPKPIYLEKPQFSRALTRAPGGRPLAHSTVLLSATWGLLGSCVPDLGEGGVAGEKSALVHPPAPTRCWSGSPRRTVH